MSISAWIIKGVGVILAIFGLWLVVTSAVALPTAWVPCLVGAVLIAAGIVIVRGGNITA